MTFYEIRHGTRAITVTDQHPHEKLPGHWWWVRIDDNWLRVRERQESERATPELEEEVRRFVQQLFLQTGEHRAPN